MQEKEIVRFIYERSGPSDSSQIVETVIFDSDDEDQDVTRVSLLLNNLGTLLSRLVIDPVVMPFVIMHNIEAQGLIPVYLEALESGDISLIHEYLESPEFQDDFDPEETPEEVKNLSEFVRFQRKFKNDMGFQKYVFDILKQEGTTF